MSAVVLDTHVWTWTLLRSARLSAAARAANDGAETTWISPVSFFEIAQKVRIGKWPEMKPVVARLPAMAAAQGARISQLDAGICLLAGSLRWQHRDPFDRMLAATALHYGLPIISADAVFDGIVSRIW